MVSTFSHIVVTSYRYQISILQEHSGEGFFFYLLDYGTPVAIFQIGDRKKEDMCMSYCNFAELSKVHQCLEIMIPKTAGFKE